MFCNICAAKCVFESQWDKIIQQWDSKKMEIDLKKPWKPKLFVWNEEDCKHQKQV